VQKEEYGRAQSCKGPDRRTRSKNKHANIDLLQPLQNQATYRSHSCSKLFLKRMNDSEQQRGPQKTLDVRKRAWRRLMRKPRKTTQPGRMEHCQPTPTQHQEPRGKRGQGGRGRVKDAFTRQCTKLKDGTAPQHAHLNSALCGTRVGFTGSRGGGVNARTDQKGKNQLARKSNQHGSAHNQTGVQTDKYRQRIEWSSRSAKRKSCST
jgi:hypothetical protein